MQNKLDKKAQDESPANNNRSERNQMCLIGHFGGWQRLLNVRIPYI